MKVSDLVGFRKRGSSIAESSTVMEAAEIFARKTGAIGRGGGCRREVDRCNLAERYF